MQLAGKHITDRIVFADFTANVALQMQNYDLLVMPSLTEGIPITLLEALRGKIPVCASNVGGIPKVLGEDYSFLFSTGSSEVITQTIKDFLRNNLEEREQLVNRNYKKFEELFSVVNMQDRYCNVYSILVN